MFEAQTNAWSRRQKRIKGTSSETCQGGEITMYHYTKELEGSETSSKRSQQHIGIDTAAPQTKQSTQSNGD